jgi:hypothetical protein
MTVRYNPIRPAIDVGSVIPEALKAGKWLNRAIFKSGATPAVT